MVGLFLALGCVWFGLVHMGGDGGVGVGVGVGVRVGVLILGIVCAWENRKKEEREGGREGEGSEESGWICML